MTRVLKSNALMAMRFPALPVVDAAGRELRDDDGFPRFRLPEVVLPRGTHSARERAAGMISYVELTDEQQARLQEDRSFRGMVRNRTFEWTEFARIPIELLPDEQRRDAERLQLQQENALLRNELRKHDLAVPVFNPGPSPVPADGKAPEAVDLAGTDVSIPTTEAEEPPVRPAFGPDTRLNPPGMRIA